MDWSVTAPWQKEGSKLQPESTPGEPLNMEASCTAYVPRQLSKWKRARPGAEQDEYARTILSWGTKRPSTAWASAQHDTAGICVSGFQSHWKSRQSAPELLLVPVTKANPGLEQSDEKISEKGNVLVPVFTCDLAQRFPGQDPKIWQMCKTMRNNYNLGCWETINRLNLFSNVISPNLTGLVMHSACCYTYSLMWRAIGSLRLHHDWHLLNIHRFSRQVKKQPIYRYLLHISARLPMTFGHVFSPPILNATFFATLILYDDIFLVELVTLQVLMGAPYW